jgi:hypothetical protein
VLRFDGQLTAIVQENDALLEIWAIQMNDDGRWWMAVQGIVQ